MKYIDEFKENDLRDPLDVCISGIRALGKPDRTGPLEIAQNCVLPTALGVEKYDLDRTPYARQILADLNLSNREWNTVVFCAVQRAGKSQLGEFLLASSIMSSVDSLVMYGSQALARDGQNQGLRRLIANNKELKERVLGGHGNSVFSIKTKAGSFVSALWPSESNIRQRTATTTVANDADLLGVLEEKGDVIGLLHARGQTKGSRQMHFVESAAYAPIDIAHDEAPDRSEMDLWDAYPAGGVIGMWLKGTRCLWFWKCHSCDEHFHAAPENFHVDLDLEPKDAAKQAFVACPHCGQVYNTPAEKYRLNLGGQWFGPSMVPVPDLPANKIRSYRLFGPAAGFASWHDLALDWSQAWQTEKSTGDKSSLQRAYTSSMGLQWVDPNAKENEKIDLESRLEEGEKRVVPDDAHFLITTIDQQKSRFVVQVEAFGRDAECWIVDRYNVTQSPNRVGEDGKSLTIAPGSYEEDYAALDKVLKRQYKTAAGSVVTSKLVLMDSGGGESATQNTYTYWKKYVKGGGDPNFFRLIKGRDTGERIDKSATTKDKSGVILHLLNTLRLKDEVAFMLARTELGPRYLHIPAWLGSWFLDELQSEKKDPKTGKWSKKKDKSNNEALDLMCYSLAGFTMVGGETIDFDNPPSWAKRMGDRGGDGSGSVENDLDWLKNIARQLNR